MSSGVAFRPSPAAIAIPVVIALCWAIPRLVVHTVGIDGPWAPYLYQYLLGGLVFGIGLWVIRASGACDFRRPGDRTWFWVLVFGYAWYAALHGVVTWLAVSVPFLGE
jgi:hypothetical protein